MRDFTKQPPKDSKPTVELGDKLHSRKKMLTLLLVVLIIAFIVSFAFQSHSTQSQTETVNTQNTTQQTTTITNKTGSTTEDSDTTNSDDEDIDLPSTALADSDENAITQDLAENNESVNIEEPEEPKARPLKFTFYDSLTHNQVQVDAGPQPIVQYRITYMLQVGSYRSETDANAVRARLLLAGLSPQVEQVGNWYRVVIRDITSRRDGDAIRHRVERAGISGSLLRETSRERIETPVEDNGTSA